MNSILINCVQKRILKTWKQKEQDGISTGIKTEGWSFSNTQHIWVLTVLHQANIMRKIVCIKQITVVGSWQRKVRSMLSKDLNQFW